MTLRYGIWSDQPALKNANAVEQDASLSTLVQMFEPIRADLEKVEAEFYRHVESQVDLIPKIGRYIQNGGGDKTGRSMYHAAVLKLNARMSSLVMQGSYTYSHLMTNADTFSGSGGSKAVGAVSGRSPWAIALRASASASPMKSS